VDAAKYTSTNNFEFIFALENDLEIIPVLNKVDLPSANPEEVSDDIVDLLGVN
jgi:GTP-binding protein LepA